MEEFDAMGPIPEGATMTEEDWEGLQFRVDRMRLIRQHSRSVRRRKPRYLGYDDAAKWVAKMAQWETREDWLNWLASGEKRNPYIPNKPDEYYGDQFKGWDHFLRGEEPAPSSLADDDDDADGVVEE